MQVAGGQVFALNFYNECHFSDELVPNFYVLTDPRWFSQLDDDSRVQATWEYIRRHPSVTLVAPATVEVGPLYSGTKCIYVNTIGLDGWTRNTNPTRARGYVGLTAYTAMALAQFMGFEPIYLCGFDSDAFRGIVLDDDLQVGLAPHHAYREHAFARLLPIKSVDAALEFYARHFHDLQLFDLDRFVNLTPNSLLGSIRSGFIPDL